MSLAIRPSRPDDLPAIAAIYAHHVVDTLNNLELTPPDIDEIARRRDQALSRGMPHLVAEIDGAVAGFAYAGQYRARAGFDNTVESAVYLAAGHEGRGIGRALMTALIDACAAAGFRQMVAVIGNAGNAASIGLHRALGFTEVGRLPAIGWKHGRWLDCVLMQRALGPGSAEPPRRG